MAQYEHKLFITREDKYLFKTHMCKIVDKTEVQEQDPTPIDFQ